MLVILHSGQTGVERGAHRGALAAGIQLAGFMPLDRRDELGPIPADVAQHLTWCRERGPRPAVRSNVSLASGVVLVVPNRTTASKFTAMGAVLAAVRAAKAPWLAVDDSSNLDDVTGWVRALAESSGSVRIHVTGPRGTRWADGEVLAMRLVANLA
jgi:hypothetical protein